MNTRHNKESAYSERTMNKQRNLMSSSYYVRT